MLVVFSSEVYGDIIMFGDVAKQLLKMMGQSGNVPGAIDAESVPAALQRLKEAVKAEKQADANEEDNKNEDEDEPDVGIAQRAVPLIEMLTAAEKENSYVKWEKK